MRPAETDEGRGARDDERLMDGIASGSAGALGELYDRYCTRAYGVARSVCRDSGRAEDAVQEAFISIWRSPARYRSQGGTVSSWLLTVVRYRAIDVNRRNEMHAGRRAGDHVLAALPAPDDVAAHVTSREDADRLRGLLARLPDAQREVLTLAFWGQLTHTEIAARLGLPAGTIKGRMRLGLQKLRDSEQAAG